MDILAHNQMQPDPPVDRTVEAFRAAEERRRSPDSALHVAARLCSAASRDLLEDLADPGLSDDYFKSAGTRLGHYGRLVLTEATRACYRCWSPLYSPDERLSGLCQPCAEDRRARIAIAARQDGAK